MGKKHSGATSLNCEGAALRLEKNRGGLRCIVQKEGIKVTIICCESEFCASLPQSVKSIFHERFHGA